MSLNLSQPDPLEARLELAELSNWVVWLRQTYEGCQRALQDCWPNHAGVVLELRSLQAWWRGIYLDRAADVSEAESGREAVSWHEALARAQERFGAAFRHCQGGHTCDRLEDRSKALQGSAERTAMAMRWRAERLAQLRPSEAQQAASE